MEHIAFLGLGAMGVRMAANLLNAGYPLRVWNRTPGRATDLLRLGAHVAESPRAAATGADVVIAMVRDDAASQSVWLGEDGALGALSPEALAMECSTLTPDWTRALDGHVRAVGARFLEAPLAGSRPQAEARQLIFFLGGEPEDAAHAAPLLAHVGKAQHPVGPVGSGALAKLAVNALLAAQVALAAELVAMLRKTAVDPGVILSALSASPVASPALNGALAAMQSGQHAPQFPIALAEKDLTYALATAHGAGAPLPITDAVQAAFARAIDQGYGQDHITGVIQMYP